ncbi:MAG: RNA methyltransferase [Nakamurella sp.]
MSTRIDISDPSDPRVDDFRDLTRADRRPDRPGGRGLVIAEGIVVARRLVASAYPLRALLGVPRRYDEFRGELADKRAPFYVATTEVMAEIVGFRFNRGVLALADRVAFPPADRLLVAGHRIAVLENVSDHENIGALFRNAAALGIDGVLLSGSCADPLYRRSVRVSMGNVFSVPFASIPPLDQGGCDLLHENGYRIVALTPRADGIPLADVSAALSGGIAIVLGSEGFGLSEESLAVADVLARIPMAHGVDSLNVATAGAIAFAALSGH